MNFAGSIARFFVYNRPLTILLLIATVLAGVGSYLITPKQYNPEVVMPAFQITVKYPGATAKEVDTFITRELEEKLADIQGVDTITSRSMDGGVSIVMVEFFVGYDLEEAKTKVLSKITGAADLREAGMSEPLVQNINPDNVPILTYGFSSDLLSQNQIRSKVVDIMNSIQRVDGVANLQIHGGQRKALRIILDPGKMRLLDISPQDVEDAIRATNARVPVGTIRGGNYTRSIEIDGRLLDDTNAGNIYIAPYVQLADIAQIEDTSSELVSYVDITRPGEDAAVRTEQAVFLSIAKRKGENAITVAQQVHQALEQEMKKDKYENLSYETFRDDGVVASQAIRGLGSNLIQSVGIVFLVLLLFLGIRSALLVALAIPLSLALVFVAGLFSGQTINRITLFALILSLGLLVDSATVVVENITRHARTTRDIKKAIVTAINEVGIGLFLSTITSVIVFLPTSQISGMMGAYMGPLSFFVPMALTMSLLVAYILIPLLADVFLPSAQRKNKTKKKIHPILNRIHRWIKIGWNKIRILLATVKRRIHPHISKQEKKPSKNTSFFDTLTDQYGKILSYLLGHKRRQHIFLAVTFTLLVVVLTFPVLRLVHFRMLPSADKAQYYLYIDAPHGTDLEQTYSITQDIITLLMQDPETVSVQSFVGEPPVVDFNGMYKGSYLREALHLATLRVNLTEPTDRTIPSEDLVQAMRARMQESTTITKYRKDGVVIRFIEDPPGPPVQATLVAKIKGPDPAVREDIARDMVKLFEQIRGVVDIDTSIEEPFFRTVYEVDHQKALESAVTTVDIMQALQTALGPVRVSQYHVPGYNEIAYIELLYDTHNRDTIQDIDSIFVKSRAGDMVPLLSVVEKRDTRNIPTWYNDERLPTTYVTAEMEKRSVIYAVIDILSGLLSTDYTLPDGGELQSWDLFELQYADTTGAQYTIDWGGEWEMTLENFRDLGIAMLVAFVLIYAVLVAQFRSFGAPGLIMSTIPLGFLGILPGFAILDAIEGTFLTATSLIGFIALMGIVVNNAILYLEYYGQLITEGKTVHQALLEAGTTRLRPILLTSTTTVLGSLTIAADPVWSGLAWSIVFGLSLSSLFTLGVFPILLNLNRPRVG